MDKDRFFQMRVDDAFVWTIDEWRRAQPDIPSRAAAIRRLVERGIVQGRDDAWADCASELYSIILQINDKGSVSKEMMEIAKNFFSKTASEFISNFEEARKSYGVNKVDYAIPTEKSLIEKVKRCKNIKDLNRIWDEEFPIIHDIGSDNTAFWHRIAGLFALKKAELQTGEETAFFDMLEPPSPTPREIVEQSEIDRHGAGRIFNAGREAGLSGASFQDPPYRLPVARELWLKGYIRGQSERSKLSAAEVAGRLREIRKQRDAAPTISPDIEPEAPDEADELKGPMP